MFNSQLNRSLHGVYILTMYLYIAFLGICVYEPRNYALFIPVLRQIQLLMSMVIGYFDRLMQISVFQHMLIVNTRYTTHELAGK